jgi:hypothetical protein
MEQPSSLKEIEIILPTITFIVGYLLSNIDKYIDNRKKKSNVRAIFLKELVENYKLLNSCMPTAKNRIPPPPLVSIIFQKLSFSVYDKYLDRLDILKKDELNAIYDSYMIMKNTFNDSTNFLRDVENKSVSHEQTIALATSIINNAESAHEKIEKALSLFKNGERIIQELKPEKGSAIKRFDKIKEMLSKDKNNF